METENKIIEHKSNHHGRNLRRIRRALDIKQDVLATMMELSQTQISTYEQKSVINDQIIERFAKALNVTPELIREMEEDPVTVIIENNTFEDSTVSSLYSYNNGEINNAHNPVDRIIELTNEKTALYERMLELEKEKNALLEKLLREK